MYTHREFPQIQILIIHTTQVDLNVISVRNWGDVLANKALSTQA